jgi:hypothetical protein
MMSDMRHLSIFFDNFRPFHKGYLKHHWSGHLSPQTHFTPDMPHTKATSTATGSTTNFGRLSSSLWGYSQGQAESGTLWDGLCCWQG